VVESPLACQRQRFVSTDTALPAEPRPRSKASPLSNRQIPVAGAADLPRAGAHGLEQHDSGNHASRAGERRRLQPDNCRLSGPDIVIEEQPKEPGRGLKTIHVVQLKYTMDYDLDRVCDIAESQHRLLMERLSSQPGQLARLHVIPLGVAGGMHQALDPTLLQLRVERKDLARMRRDLHGSALCHTDPPGRYSSQGA
jgi:hypothetical protein